MVARWIVYPMVVGSSPIISAFFKYTEIFQSVEFGLWEPEVVSSSLAFRTMEDDAAQWMCDLS